MRNLFKLFTVILMFSCNKNEGPQEQVKNNSIEEYSAAETLVEIDEEIISTIESTLNLKLKFIGVR